MNKSDIPTPILLNIFLSNLETGKNKDRKNTNIDSCHFNNSPLAHFSKNNSSDQNLSEIDNIIDKTFFQW